MPEKTVPDSAGNPAGTGNTDQAGRFPASMELFKFCRNVLGIRRPGSRVMDQDVGALLALDPAECTHWKKGRKQIRSVDAARNISVQLGCADWIVSGVMSGTMNASEGLEEVKGYGPFAVDPVVVESVFRDLKQNHPDQWTPAREALARQNCRIDLDAIKAVVAGIHSQLGFSEPPFYLPELLRLMSKATVEDVASGLALELQSPRPVARFHAARKLAAHFMTPSVDPGRSNLPLPLKNHAALAEANLFALELLAPVAMVRREIASADPSQDLVARLSEVFWLSRSLINLQVKAAILSVPSSAGVR